MKTELMFVRLLYGELAEADAQALRERIAQEPELARAWARWNAAWEGLAAPPATPVPAGFATRVMARARQQSRAVLGWSVAPLWVRTVAATALVVGVVVGASLSRQVGASDGTASGPPGIYDSYVDMVSDPSSPASSSDAGGGARP
jgi:ferric-dicitrate binding protein FerR (iron transport regulator)